MRSGLVMCIGILVGLTAMVAPMAHAVIDYELTFTGNHAGTPQRITKVVDFGEELFRHTLVNTGTETDTYSLVCTAEYYTGDEFGFLWSLCTSIACVLPDIVTQVTLAPAEQDTVTLKMFPIMQEGGSRVTMTCTSQADPSQVVVMEYAVVRDGTAIVLIDDDGGDAYEQFVIAGLDQNAESFAVFDTEIQSLDDTAWTFDDQDHLVYMSGDESTGTITTADASVLGAYLDAGGRLIVSGQDLFDDISGSAFATTYLAATRLATTSQTQVTGTPGDAVGNGLSFAITGGAGNQVSQDVIAGGITAFAYTGSSPVPPWSGAGVRRETATFKTISFGFGLEALSATSLGQLLARASTWFDAPLVGVPAAGQPGSLIGARAWPNPIRAAGQIRLMLPEGFDAPVRVDLFDAGGRRVGTLTDRMVGGGTRELPLDVGRWALPAGTYSYRVTADQLTTSGKFTVVQ